MRSRSMTVATLLAAAAASSTLGQPLPQDPALVTGELDNGLRYIVMQHDNPPGRAQIYLHVSTGSLNETDRQRGIAHFLEHMAFNGGENFPPGEVVPFFESLGLTFGRHQNAFTSFDQTTYILELPKNDSETLDQGLSFFDDVADGLLLQETEIELERGVILEEDRSRKGPQQRVQEVVFKNIAPGSTFGERLPIGVPETIRSMTREDFQDYYETWYTPSNMTVIAVADMAPEVVVGLIEARLGGGEKVPQPVDKPTNVEPYDEMFAIVASDDELTTAVVTLAGIAEPREPVTTEQRFREGLVDALASAAFNRRLDRLVAEDEVRFRSGGAFVADLFDAMRLSQAEARGNADQWQQMLTELAFEYQRARLHGFSESELDKARAEIISGFERFAETAQTLPAGAHLNRINSAVASGSAILSGDQQLELGRRLLPEITSDEVSTAFASLFSDQKLSVIVELPTAVGVPTEEEVVALARKALDVEPDPWSDSESAASILAQLPTPGTTVELDRHEEADVTSAWLSNGVRVHHRYMDERDNSATIQITLAGGQLLETAANRGVTDGASVVFNRPATRSLTSTNITDLMTGAKANVSGSGGADSLTLTVSGNPEDFDRAMQLAHALITEPLIEEAAFRQWKEQTVQSIKQSKLTPIGQVSETLFKTVLGEGESRFFPPSIEQIEAITLDQAQAWLEETMTNAPIEVAIVGDIERDRGFELVEQYIGSLGDRPRISTEFHEEIRKVSRNTGPMRVTKRVQTATPVAVVVAGSFGPDAEARDDSRRMSMATQILSTRMIKRIREEEQLVYSIGAQAIAVQGYDEMGLVFSFAPTEPSSAETLETRVHEMFTEFARSGPTEEEMSVALKQVLNTYDEQIKQAGFWGSQLRTMTYHDRELDRLLGAPEQYASFTPEDIRKTFAKYYTEDNRFSVIVAPEVAAAEPDAGDEGEAADNG